MQAIYLSNVGFILVSFPIFRENFMKKIKKPPTADALYLDERVENGWKSDTSALTLYKHYFGVNSDFKHLESFICHINQQLNQIGASKDK